MDLLLVARLLHRTHIDPATGCYTWTGANNGRYGYTRCGAKVRRVHRVGWEAVTGTPAPPILHHGCGNGFCWNPTHLVCCANQAEHYICDWKMREAIRLMNARYTYLVTND